MIVTVADSDLTGLVNEGSVWVFTGTTEEGQRVRFGVDHRMADGLVHEVLLSGEVPCEVESWAILGPVGPLT